ncbi:putative ribonuclease H protein [Citrus sinensis]|nr:putative ribonuclease H protein [Citrus sinensis]
MHFLTLNTRPFRFLAAWLTHEHFNNFVKRMWNPQSHYSAAASHFVQEVQVWNRDVFGNIFQRKRRLMARINGIQATLEKYSSRSLRRLEARLRNELEMVMSQEEILWLQKSRKDWLLHGDRNTNFFHKKTIARRRRNRIEAIRDSSGNWLYDEEDIKRHAVGYFSELFKRENAIYQNYHVPNFFPDLSSHDVDGAAAPILREEIKSAVFSMKPLKALDTDGLHAIFYQSQWYVVGPSFCRFIDDIFTTGKVPQEINTTLLVLIPKEEHPTSLKMFRPISLCTMAYKTVTKIIATRLQSLLPNLIGPNQTSFVPGRNIVDNIVVAQEVVHSMRRKTGRKGFMAIKVDLEKAYDWLNWDFIFDTLQQTGIPTHLSRLIMDCVTSASMSILWNGEVTGTFTPGRDDLLLFVEASIDQAYVVDVVLENYCRSSEAKINKLKTKVFFSKNVDTRDANLIGSTLGFSATNNLGDYLGMPLIHTRVNKSTYQSILDKVDNRLTGWNATHLSFAGRVTLAQSVLQAMPIYAMQTTFLPSPVRHKIDKSCRRFIWDGNSKSPKMTNLPMSLPDKPGSQIWRAIRSKWLTIVQGARWSVCDGGRARFWIDCWATKYPLSSLALQPIPQELINATVSEFTNGQGGWNWSSFEHLLPHYTLMQIASVMPPRPHFGSDKIYWGLDPSGMFTVRSAYASLCYHHLADHDRIWKLPWSWKGPQSIRLFLWQLMHGKLKTHVELARRHINAPEGCDRCGGAVEDILHALRDYCCINQVWRKLVPMATHNAFFNSNLREWITGNLQNKWKIASSLPWDCIFGVVVWRLWFWRNHFLFAGKLVDGVTVYMDAMARANEIYKVYNSGISQQPRRKEIFIRWIPPPWPWCKLNSDGSRKNDREAGAGGVIQDSVGHWISGFCMRIGESSVLMAELWGLYQGLILAWDVGIKRLLVEVDSLCITQIISKQVVVPNVFHALIVAVHELLSRNWQIAITHIYREANSAADFMANMAHSAPLGLQVFSDPPMETFIKELPHELKALKNLKCLNLEYMRYLHTIPRQLLCNFSGLKVLRMLDCGSANTVPEDSVLFGGSEILVEELITLEHLNVLSVTLRSFYALRRLLSCQQYKSCKYALELRRCEDSRSWNILSIADLKSSNNKRTYGFNSLQSVTIDYCSKLREMTRLVFAPNLKMVHVERCYEMEEIISVWKVEEVPGLKPFAKLQYLRLQVLRNLKKICLNALPFPNLLELFVSGCPNLKKLPLDYNSAKERKLVIRGEQHWWNELQWKDKATLNAFTPCFKSI